MINYTRRKNIYGVGINDSDYEVCVYDTVSNKRMMIWRCPFYNKWEKMLRRCYNQKCQTEQPTYIGCSVCEEWLIFSNFKRWMETQDWEGKQLDKDILVPGNKVYSPETCVFVSKELNKFFNKREKFRGEYPIGVHLCNKSKKFQSRCSNPFTKKREYLGLFSDPESAHEAWKKRKHELALKYVDEVTDPRIVKALTTRFKDEM